MRIWNFWAGIVKTSTEDKSYRKSWDIFFVCFNEARHQDSDKDAEEALLIDPCLMLRAGRVVLFSFSPQ